MMTGAVYGRRAVMNREGTALLPTQLISARDKGAPKQWCVTLAPPSTDNGSIPWESSFDGAVFPPVPPAIFTAPIFAGSASNAVLNALQLNLRWGAGGVAFQTRFDYPQMGGVFGIIADHVTLDAVFRGGRTFPGGAPTPATTPVLGAFMVEGKVADPSPLRWLEKFQTLDAVGIWWAIKPYSRAVRISVVSAGAQNILVEFADSNGNVIRAESFAVPVTAGVTVTYDLTSIATLVKLTADVETGSAVSVEWKIGLV